VPVTRVGGRAVRQLDLEEAVAVDGHVELVAGLLQIALREHARGRNQLHAGTQLQSGGQLGLLARSSPLPGADFWYSRSSNSATCRLYPLVPTLARLLEMTSQLRLLGVHAGLGDPKAPDHLRTP